MNEKVVKGLLTGTIYFSVFLLLIEWLKPVIELTDTEHLKLFSYFLGISLLFYFVQLNWKITTPLKLIYIGGVIAFLYTEESLFSRESVFFLTDTIQFNMQALLSQQWTGVTDDFRTLLFFVLLWMTTYLLNYWIRVRKNIWLFFIMTVLFVTILDTFSPYNGEKSIVTVLMVGFFVSGVLYAKKVMGENNKKASVSFLAILFASLFGVIVLSAVIAYTLPKAGPSWPDPVPFLTSVNNSATSEDGGSKRVGYGENDEQLGGAFIGDDSPVFRATLQTKQYWKIETKDTYTSKGWIQSDTEDELVSSDKTSHSIVSDILSGTEEEKVNSSISMMQEFPFVMQPYGITNVASVVPFTATMTVANQKLSTFNGGSPFSILDYDVEYSEPSYSLRALRETTTENLGQLSSDFDRYLQLPESLPDRVTELATKITEDQDSLYEKAKKIERYFRQSGFSYSQQLAAIPEGDTDYVDQFLFDTKVGYCDNFSTSMVVMLRSQGIPARWVKGFTAGEVVQTESNRDTYEVTNNNAHSWVEAYFPGVGWMNFEPTIGFSNGPNLEYDLETQSDAIEAPKPVEPDTPENKNPVKENTEVSRSFTEVMQDFGKWISNNKAAIIWSLVGLFMLSLILYQFRRRWISKVLIPLNRMRKNDWESYEKMYHQLLWLLKLYGLDREQGQTLSSYAKTIDAYFGGNDMRKLTDAYEKGFYGDDKDSINYASLKEKSENLINRFSS
ncbi:transglutaminase superfamily protein [Psychrobacillus insolitus]|uniref:Transglutaminase superfamily protein n=1 Tax=Psychrobacillus insolitus TaxID=1461 RepID=A0A2W7MDZ1_9BACI|nr:transglutaminase domain-containing protein [Psychrobacillus insolitus]PZX04495.1 transglutaminase superfamily protein [Psychrobacillus insolitus]